MKYIFMLLFFCSVYGQDTTPLAERIKSVGEQLLEGYTQPLTSSFGTGISTGLFTTARSHELLGFDLGARLLYVQIPAYAKYFDGTALTCSLANNNLVYDSVAIDSISTIFGPKEQTNVPVSGNAVGIPPYIPGGYDLPGLPLVVPQLNIGLLFGSEILVRYVPFTFKGSSIKFLGLGLKEHINRLPFMQNITLPVDIAVGGALQNFGIKDTLGSTIVSSRTWNVQLIISKDLIAFEPVIGFGFEGTKIYFDYDFEFEIPDSSGGPGARTTVSENVNIELVSQNSYRAIIGFNLKLGIFLLHYDYNLVPDYNTHNLTLGFSVR